jgi:hypothetical protein
MLDLSALSARQHHCVPFVPQWPAPCRKRRLRNVLLSAALPAPDPALRSGLRLPQDVSIQPSQSGLSPSNLATLDVWLRPSISTDPNPAFQALGEGRVWRRDHYYCPIWQADCSSLSFCEHSWRPPGARYPQRLAPLAPARSLRPPSDCAGPARRRACPDAGS